MMAMERSSDLVIMQCYALLLVRVDPGARQRQPDFRHGDALELLPELPIHLHVPAALDECAGTARRQVSVVPG